MTKKGALALVILFLFSGCSSPPDSGYVKRRELSPAWTEFRTNYICTGYDKNGMCTLRIPNTYPVHHEAEYYLVLLDDKKDDKGKQRTAKRQVTVQEYNHYHVDMHYPEDR